MRAVVCVPGGTEVTDVPDPVPGVGEVVVAVEACGLCGSDVHAVAAGFARPGQILGHEFSGRIAETGRGVTGWQAGQAVAVNPLGSCGTCRACGGGVPFRCDAMPNLGISAPGAFAQFAAVPQAQLVALPDGLPVEVGAHAEPLAVALQAVSQAGAGPGDAVLVYGVGPIGLSVIMALRLAGVDAIVAAGRSAGRRAAAARVGAGVVIDTRQVGVTEYATQAGLRFTAAIECSGAPGSVAEALGLLEPGGSCVEVALTSEDAAVPLLRMVGDGLRLSGTCAFSNPAYEAAVGHLAAGRVPAADLISERVSLADTPAALVRLRAPGDLVKILTRPGQ